MLEVKDINVFYGESQALWNISLNVKEEELVAIVGSNGAGKTTLLRTISGLLCSPTGSITFFNKRIDRLPTHQIVAQGISHVPEGRRPFPYMTTKENLELGSYFKEARKNRKEALQRVFSIFPLLEERQNQLAGTLSGGEQQMLAIGRGLMSNPKLIMFDEPSLGLSPLLVEKLFSTIQEIRKNKIMILLVEQNVRSSLLLADRSYILENGTIKLEGRAKELLNNDHVKKMYLGL